MPRYRLRKRTGSSASVCANVAVVLTTPRVKLRKRSKAHDAVVGSSGDEQYPNCGPAPVSGLGSRLGCGVGVTVDEAVALTVGDVVAVTVGNAVAVMVGVGTVVAVPVGLAVGVSVGSGVGVLVSVGEGVGVSSALAMRVPPQTVRGCTAKQPLRPGVRRACRFGCVGHRLRPPETGDAHPWTSLQPPSRAPRNSFSSLVSSCNRERTPCLCWCVARGQGASGCVTGCVGHTRRRLLGRDGWRAGNPEAPQGRAS